MKNSKIILMFNLLFSTFIFERNVKYGNVVVDLTALVNLWGLNFNLS